MTLPALPFAIACVSDHDDPRRLHLICDVETWYRYGDKLDGKTTSLCVRRAVYVDPETGKEDPAKKGVCSNFLCDAKPGDSVSLTGPAGKVMLLPESKPEVDLIWVATGTGIAPYRSFARRLFAENTPASKAFKGKYHLVMIENIHSKLACYYDCHRCGLAVPGCRQQRLPPLR